MKRPARVFALPAICAIAALLGAGHAVAQTPGPGGPGGPHGGMGPHFQAMQEMMDRHEQRLEELVAKMNAASGSAKVDAIAAIINEMMVQRREMSGQRDALRQQMGDRMRKGMGRHGQLPPAPDAP